MPQEKTNYYSCRFDPHHYESNAYLNLGGSLVSARELSDIVQFSKIDPRSFVLDVGMGPGRVLGALASTNATLVGIDADPRMVRYFARQRKTSSAPYKVNAHLIVASGDHLPFREEVFGAVVCIRVLRYFDQPAKAIAEMSRVLKHDGRLVMEFANMFRPQSIIQIAGYLRARSVYPRLFTRRTVLKWLSKNGIVVEIIRGWHRVPVEMMVSINGRIRSKILTNLDQVLDGLFPPEFLSRSLVVSGVKTSYRLTERFDGGN